MVGQEFLALFTKVRFLYPQPRYPFADRVTSFVIICEIHSRSSDPSVKAGFITFKNDEYGNTLRYLKVLNIERGD